jgi:1-deoxyxylulose-5-phosphate synthase
MTVLRQRLPLRALEPRPVGSVAMEYVNLGSTGMRVSRVCLGMMSFGNDSDRPWVLDESAAEPIVRAAAEGGITFFDTADTYSAGASEVATGRLLSKFFSREEMVVATKVFNPVGRMAPGGSGHADADGRAVNARGLSRKHIMSGIDDSLQRLDMEYVDLYQIHRWDYRTPIEETMEALHDVVRAGKARYIGASSMFAWQFAKAQHLAERNGWTRFVTMQNHYNLLYREEEREMIPQCIDQGVGVLPWSPLARGVLTGTRSRGGEKHTTRANTDSFTDALYSHPADFDVVDRVGGVAAELGIPAAQVALAWLLQRRGVTAPIVGATKTAHLHDALAAEQVELSEDQVRRLEELYVPHPVLGHQ